MMFAIDDFDRARDVETDTVRRAADGDSDAFAELVERYQNMVYNLALQSLHNADDAFDASQDVFLKAYRALNTFRGDSKFSTWIYRITLNTIRDYIRSRSRRITPISLSDYGDGNRGENGEARQLDIPDTDPSRSPSEVLERKARDEAVRDAISSLSESHREVVVMRDIEGCSYEEISDRLGLELGTVKSRINRARIAVKDYLVKRNIL